MPSDQIVVNINLAAVTRRFFRQLQHQLDVIKVLQVGCERVTAAQVSEQQDFGAFVPADGAQLTHEAAQSEAQEWLLRGFLRDAIECTGLFIDDCLQTCELVHLVAAGTANSDELHRILHHVPKTNHRLHFPAKLQKLEHRFGIVTPYDRHVLSLNKARTCVVHRLGLVSELDADETGTLNVCFQHFHLVARGCETGLEVVLDRSGIQLTEESVVQFQFTDTERRFRIGEKIKLQAHELYDTIITLWRFGHASVQSIEGYGRMHGLDFPSEVSN